MKKLISLALALGLVLAFAVSASAVEVNVKGSFDFMWGWNQNPGFFATGQQIAQTTNTDDSFRAVQRERVQVDFVASENVKGTIYFEIGETVWGFDGGGVGKGTGGGLGADGVSVEVRRAFITFNVPNTDLIIQPGIQGMALPAAVMGSPIFDDDVAGVVTTYQFNDVVGVGAFWARPANNENNYRDAAGSFNDEADMFGIYVPVTMDGVFSFTPFFVYASVGTDSALDGAAGITTNASNPRNIPIWNPDTRVHNNDYQHLYFAGGAFEFTMLDPLTFAADVNWGMSDDPSDKFMDRSGWYFAGKIAYKTPYVTPALIGWYSTGDDGNIYNGSERMPVVSGSLNGSSYALDGSSLIGGSGAVFSGDNGWMGTWGIGLELGSISFIEDLTHTIRVNFMGGTSAPHAMRDYRSINDGVNFLYTNNAGIMLTTKDWAWEINFDHKYQIYENLAAVVEMGMIDIYRKKSAWLYGVGNIDPVDNPNGDIKLWKTSTAWKLAFGLKYSF